MHALRDHRQLEHRTMTLPCPASTNLVQYKLKITSSCAWDQIQECSSLRTQDTHWHHFKHQETTWWHVTPAGTPIEQKSQLLRAV